MADDGLRMTSNISSSVICHPPSEWKWNELKVLILSPGVPLTHPKPHAVVEMAHKNNVPVIGEMELLFRAQPEATYIGITGTNGKSTTTTLIGHILQASGVVCEVGGNLGTPALALAPLGKGGVYVIEMSSYQLDLVKTTRFNVAVFLNITPDHLDRHGDMAGYVAAKKKIFDRQTAGDVAVIAVDDEFTRGIRQEALGSSVIEVSSQRELTDGVYVKDGILHDTSLMPNAYSLLPITSLTGKHNWQNAAAAYAATKAVGVAPEKIYAAMKSFGGLRHRLQLVATIGGVRFINDSKATNADATGNALAPYKNILWIAGGKAKAGGITSLTEYFPNVTHAFLIGEAAQDFAKTLEGKVAYTQCGTLEVAVAKAYELSYQRKLVSSNKENMDASLRWHDKEEPVILLSPACASFDQFKSFEHRGDVFCELVEAMQNKAIKNVS
jgi:UDP-N-acetylmuramoylalanine--D-glutamate ligase